jgi:chemotaxis protein CheX
MDVRYINPFIEAIQLAFRKMIHMPVQVKGPTVRTAKSRMSDRHATVIRIDLVGGSTGTVLLRIPRPIACELIRAFSVGVSRTLDAEGLDALGEIANIIVGNAKRSLPGAVSSISTPQVLPDGAVPFPEGKPILVVPISSSLGLFWLEAQLQTGEAADEQFESISDLAQVDPAATEVMVQQLIAAASQ